MKINYYKDELNRIKRIVGVLSSIVGLDTIDSKDTPEELKEYLKIVNFREGMNYTNLLDTMYHLYINLEKSINSIPLHAFSDSEEAIGVVIYGTNDKVEVDVNNFIDFEIRLMGVDINTGGVSSYRFKGSIKNVNGELSILGVKKEEVVDEIGIKGINTDITEDVLDIKIEGKNDTSILWRGNMDYTKLSLIIPEEEVIPDPDPIVEPEGE